MYSANTACDISAILVNRAEEGERPAYDFGDYKLKFSAGRSYDDLRLTNKGKMKKSKAEFHPGRTADTPSGR